MSRAALAALVLAIGLGGCARFHAGVLPAAPAEATFVEVDGVRLRVDVRGQGPAVVLLHGFGSSLEAWDGVRDALAARHRVIALDLKGFGWSSRPAGDYGPTAQAALVWHALDRLGVAEVALVGHSWGSSVALAMALGQPARVRRVALYSAYVYEDQVPDFYRWARPAGIGEALFALFYRERIEDRAPIAYHDDRYVTQARVAKVEADLDRPGTVAGALAAARGARFAALERRYHEIARPVLLLWGDDDQVTPVRFGRRLERELGDARLVTFGECGHIPMVEARVPSTRALAGFLALDLPAPPATPIAIAPVDLPPAPAAAAAAPLAAADLAALGDALWQRRFAAPRAAPELHLAGALRVRGERLRNLDLDRGLDPSGRPLYPVPASGGQVLSGGDLRLRTDAAILSPGAGVALFVRADVLDDVALGSTPALDDRATTPAAAAGQASPATPIRIERAYGEVLLPFGVLAAGRMGAHFGLGIAAHGGDCDECDGGDAADRVALVSPLAGHLVALAYDVGWSGPLRARRGGGAPIDVDPSDDVTTVSAALLRASSPATRQRRAAAGLGTLEYGALISHRWQDEDVPGAYLPGASGEDAIARDFRATALGLWLRYTRAALRVELEVEGLDARVGQPSLVPGVELTQAATSRQLGAALESEVALGPARYGFDAGLATGDDAPGFGAFPGATDAPPSPGDLDGPQVRFPADTTADNFRFHPDYRVDRILFREIVGTVTDAAYLRPRAAVRLYQLGRGHLELAAALIASWALEAGSTPGGAHHLGVEVDPTLSYRADAFSAHLDYAILVPGAGLDNPAAGLDARTAQLVRARLGLSF